MLKSPNSSLLAIILFCCLTTIPATSFATKAGRSALAVSLNDDPPRKPHHRKRGNFDSKEYFRKMEIYITKEVGLTQDEAKAFFPVFRKTKKEQRQLSRRKHEKMRAVGDQPLSERQNDRLLGEIQELHLQEAKLQNECLRKLRKILPASKVLKVIKAENEFSRKTFREMTD